MPHYHITIASDDGAIDSPDPEGVTLDGMGQARALAVASLVDAAKDRVPAGRVRTVSVTVADESGSGRLQRCGRGSRP